MSSDPSVEGARSITEGSVTVTKSFEAEEFPVPAVKFVVASDASERVSIRLADSIPEAFPMENVGFHPDFEKDNWTAYKSHRVEYDRTLDPGESTTTVYGVRLDDTDVEPAAFLSDPTVSLLDADDLGAPDEAIGDVLGEDSNQLVRDVLSGERDSLPGLGTDGVDAPDLTVDASGESDSQSDPEDVTLELDEPESEYESEFESGDEGDADVDVDDAPEPDTFDDSGTPATESADAAVEAVEDGMEEGDGDDTSDAPKEDLELELDLDEVDAGGPDDGPEPTESTGTVGAAESLDDAAEPADEGDVAGRPRVTAGSVVAALAAELERAEADSDDVEALRDALGAAAGTDEESSEAAVPRSVDLRIRRLQNQVEDLAAYSAGLEAFLDEEGTAEDIIEGFRGEVDDLTEAVDELSAAVADAADDRGRLDGDVSELRSELSGVHERLDAVEGRFDAVEDRFEETTDRLETVEDRFEETTDRLETVETRFDETADRLAVVEDRFEALDERFDAVDERLDGVADRAESADETAGRLDDEMGEVREELATLDGDIAAARADLADDLDEVRTAVEEEAAPMREDVAALRADVADLDDTVEEFRAFRDRLSNALGPMVGSSAVGADADVPDEAADESGDEDEADAEDDETEADEADAEDDETDD